MFAAAMIAAGCGNGGRESNETTPGSAGTSGSPTADANNASTMTLTGCLQRGNGGDEFILTQVNSQPRPLASSGGNESTAVREKQREAAAHAYRLNGGPANLGKWVGHQIRVTGKLEDRRRVQTGASDREVKEGDLAQLEVTSAESVAETCGDATGKRPTGRP